MWVNDLFVKEGESRREGSFTNNSVRQETENMKLNS